MDTMDTKEIRVMMGEDPDTIPNTSPTPVRQKVAMEPIDDIGEFTVENTKKLLAQQAQEEERTNPKTVAMEQRREERKAEARKKEEEKLSSQVIKETAKLSQEEKKKREEEIEKKKKAEEVILKRHIAKKIKQYVEAFPLVAPLLPKLSEKSSLEEHEAALAIVHEELDARNGPKTLRQRFGLLLSITEGVVGDGSQLEFLPPNYRPNLTGLSAAFKAGVFSQEMDPVLTEIGIEYPWLCGQGLAGRFVNAVFAMLLTTHMMNTSPTFLKMAKLNNTPPMDMSKTEMTEK